MDELVARVPADIKDLIPGFRENRRREIQELRGVVAAANFERLQHIAERMYSLGNPFGFPQITIFGREMREACDAQDMKCAGRIISRYETYLADVTVTFVESPSQ